MSKFSMEHRIYFLPKENVYCNFCTTHNYEVMTEFHKSLGTIFSSLREVATIYEKHPPVSASGKEALERVEEVEKEFGVKLVYVCYFKARPFHKERWKQLKAAYNLIYKKGNNRYGQEVCKL